MAILCFSPPDRISFQSRTTSKLSLFGGGGGIKSKTKMSKTAAACNRRGNMILLCLALPDSLLPSNDVFKRYRFHDLMQHFFGVFLR